jgi:hypothetical protein
VLQALRDLRTGAVPAGIALAGAAARTAEVLAVAISFTIMLALTRPIEGPAPDPASPAIPAVSLYPVATSAQPEQADLSAAVRAGDAAGQPGTAMLILGSALSWHQPLWAPQWTKRPLYYDNWLWSWRPDHAGTPGYQFGAGNHYPDPERTLDRAYLERHGIGVVVVTGAVKQAAASSPLLELVRAGVYDSYIVRDPVTVVTFGDSNAAMARIENQTIIASSAAPAAQVTARANWFRRWIALVAGEPTSVGRNDDGYMHVVATEPLDHVELAYALQPIDWMARGLAMVGAVFAILLAVRHRIVAVAGNAGMLRDR